MTGELPGSGSGHGTGCGDGSPGAGTGTGPGSGMGGVVGSVGVVIPVLRVAARPSPGSGCAGNAVMDRMVVAVVVT